MGVGRGAVGGKREFRRAALVLGFLLFVAALIMFADRAGAESPTLPPDVASRLAATENRVAARVDEVERVVADADSRWREVERAAVEVDAGIDTRVDAATTEAKARAAVAKSKAASVRAEVSAQVDARAARAGVTHTAAASASAPAEHGTLYMLQPDPAVPATFLGRGGYSLDGVNRKSPSTIRAEVPAGSTVVAAYLYGHYLEGNPTVADHTINFDGTTVVFTKLDDYLLALLSSARVDVTAQVAAKVGTGGGIFTFATPPQTSATGLDGLALLVIYENPSLPETTIVAVDGAGQKTGDTVTITYDAPLDTTVPGFQARMSLAIGFGYQQENSGHNCGPGNFVSSQYTTIDANGTRVTTCAGGVDDGYNLGGFTAGGVGDLTDNPTDPFQRPFDGKLPRIVDDELYDLTPFLSHGDTQLVVTTTQPDGTDLLLLSVIQVTARGRATTEVCDDGIDNDADGLTDIADLDCPQPTPPVVVLPLVVPPVVVPPAIVPPEILPLPVSAPAPPVVEPMSAPPRRQLVPAAVATQQRPRALARTGALVAVELVAAGVMVLVGLALILGRGRRT